MVVLSTVFLLLADLLCGSWNLKWFPSGRAEHRASARVEAANIADAAEVVRKGLARAGRDDGVLLCFQELRDTVACSNLLSAIGATNLSVACVTAFREYDRRLGWQQVAIVSSLPVVEARWSYWKRPRGVFPPRGYAYALLDDGANGLVACYCVHLKSNYGATTPEKREQNRRKREICAEQIVANAKKLKSPDGRKVDRVLVVGDFNADAYGGRLEGERTFELLRAAGFSDAWAGAPLPERATHPSHSARWTDSTLDYVMHRGFSRVVSRELSAEVPLSDHRMLWVRLL